MRYWYSQIGQHPIGQVVIALACIAVTVVSIRSYLTLKKSKKWSVLNASRKRFELLRCFQFVPLPFILLLLTKSGMLLEGLIAFALYYFAWKWVEKKEALFKVSDAEHLTSFRLAHLIAELVFAVFKYACNDARLKKKKILTYGPSFCWDLIDTTDDIKCRWDRDGSFTPFLTITSEAEARFDDEDFPDPELGYDDASGSVDQRGLIAIVLNISSALKIIDESDFDYISPWINDYFSARYGV